MAVRIKSKRQKSILNKSVINATIDGINYSYITPKLILNDIFNTAFGENYTDDMKNRLPENANHGINAIDIDWDNADVEGKNISSTSDLLKLIAETYVKAENLSNYTWEDIITINSNYSLYYESSDNTIIKKYTPLTISSNIISSNVAPNTATQIGVYDENNNRLYTLPLDSSYFDLEHSYGTANYSVGLISDIHYNDVCENDSNTSHKTDDEGNEDFIYEDFANALQLFTEQNDNEENKFSFICCTGDITTDSIEQLQAYKQVIGDNTDIPIYTCKGSNDNATTYGNNDEWLRCVMPGNNNEYLNYFTTGDKTSFWFMKDNDIYIFFNVDFNNSDNKATVPENDTDDRQYYNLNTIKELQQILDTYRNYRVFVFTHLFFPNKTGNVNYKFTNNYSVENWLSGKQFAILNELNNYYTNTIWFSGHSHYNWKWQSLSDRANICNWDVLQAKFDYTNYSDWAKNSNSTYSETEDGAVRKSAWNVHIPSLANPVNASTNEFDGDASECGYMDVYDNGVCIHGVVCSREKNASEEPEYVNEVQSEAIYWIPVGGSNLTTITSKSYSYFDSLVDYSDSSLSSDNSTITLNSTLGSGSYTLKYTDENGNELSNFENITDVEV